MSISQTLGGEARRTRLRDTRRASPKSVSLQGVSPQGVSPQGVEEEKDRKILLRAATRPRVCVTAERP